MTDVLLNNDGIVRRPPNRKKNSLAFRNDVSKVRFNFVGNNLGSDLVLGVMIPMGLMFLSVETLLHLKMRQKVCLRVEALLHLRMRKKVGDVHFSIHGKIGENLSTI